MGLDERKKSHCKHCLKKNSLTTILSDSVHFHNVFSAPSEDVYYKREIVEVILVVTLDGIKYEYLFRVASSIKPLPGRSIVRGVRLSFVQERSLERKLITSPMDKRVGNIRTQCKLTLCPIENERMKGPRPFTMQGVLYRMTTFIFP